MSISLNVWQLICEFCAAPELLALRVVSKSLQKLASRDFLWKRQVELCCREGVFTCVNHICVSLEGEIDWMKTMVLLNTPGKKTVIKDQDALSTYLDDHGEVLTVFISSRSAVLWKDPLVIRTEKMSLVGLKKPVLLVDTFCAILVSAVATEVRLVGLSFVRQEHEERGLKVMVEIESTASAVLHDCDFAGNNSDFGLNVVAVRLYNFDYFCCCF
jgi:hypothetical protein